MYTALSQKGAAASSDDCCKLMQPVRLLGRHCNFVCRTQLFRVASKMPKVPVTSKRARTVLSAQSLVPDSVKAALASG